MLILLKKYISTNCIKNVTFFCINFYMFLLLSNIFILYQINLII